MNELWSIFNLMNGEKRVKEKGEAVYQKKKKKKKSEAFIVIWLNVIEFGGWDAKHQYTEIN